MKHLITLTKKNIEHTIASYVEEDFGGLILEVFF